MPWRPFQTGFTGYRPLIYGGGLQAAGFLQSLAQPRPSAYAFQGHSFFQPPQPALFQPFGAGYGPSFATYGARPANLGWSTAPSLLRPFSSPLGAFLQPRPQPTLTAFAASAYEALHLGLSAPAEEPAPPNQAPPSRAGRSDFHASALAAAHQGLTEADLGDEPLQRPPPSDSGISEFHAAALAAAREGRSEAELDTRSESGISEFHAAALAAAHEGVNEAALVEVPDHSKHPSEAVEDWLVATHPLLRPRLPEASDVDPLDSATGVSPALRRAAALIDERARNLMPWIDHAPPEGTFAHVQYLIEKSQHFAGDVGNNMPLLIAGALGLRTTIGHTADSGIWAEGSQDPWSVTYFEGMGREPLAGPALELTRSVPRASDHDGHENGGAPHYLSSFNGGERKDMPGDGDCLIHGVLHALGLRSTPERLRAVRELASEYAGRLHVKPHLVELLGLTNE
jgi:hypothetical protein